MSYCDADKDDYVSFMSPTYNLGIYATDKEAYINGNKVLRELIKYNGGNGGERFDEGERYWYIGEAGEEITNYCSGEDSFFYYTVKIKPIDSEETKPVDYEFLKAEIKEAVAATSRMYFLEEKSKVPEDLYAPQFYETYYKIKEKEEAPEKIKRIDKHIIEFEDGSTLEFVFDAIKQDNVEFDFRLGDWQKLKNKEFILDIDRLISKTENKGIEIYTGLGNNKVNIPFYDKSTKESISEEFELCHYHNEEHTRRSFIYLKRKDHDVEKIDITNCASY